MIDRKYLFDSVKNRLFSGKFTQQQVDGIDLILNEWENRFEGKGDFRQLAYILATCYHESAKTFNPSIEEYGKGKDKYYGTPDPVTGKIYYGRGLSQLSLGYNYKKMGGVIGVDLYNHPELALVPENSVKILFEGMLLGLFTGKRLSQYFNEDVSDWVQARKIINGLDKASLIATQAKIFYDALTIK